MKVKGVAQWRSQDLDLALDMRVDAETNDNEVSLRVHDAHGNVLAFDAKSILPLDQMMGDPGTALELAYRAPLNARLVMPERWLH